MSEIAHTGPATYEARVRARNQVTIPESIVRALGLAEGSRVLFRVNGERAEMLVVRDSYAGALRGVWGIEPRSWLDDERAGWDR